MMKCLQCGKQAESACKRDDCGYELSVIESQKRRLAAEGRVIKHRAASADFKDNFDATMAWAVQGGHVRQQDIPTLFANATLSPTAPMVYQTIARSL